MSQSHTPNDQIQRLQMFQLCGFICNVDWLAMPGSSHQTQGDCASLQVLSAEPRICSAHTASEVIPDLAVLGTGSFHVITGAPNRCKALPQMAGHRPRTPLGERQRNKSIKAGSGADSGFPTYATHSGDAQRAPSTAFATPCTGISTTTMYIDADEQANVAA
jgi:hypothetical protein